jgi:hypothetical protein
MSKSIEKPPRVSNQETIVEDEKQPSAGGGSGVSNTYKALEPDDNPYGSHCRADADIWRFYLSETEVEDKELTGLWNSSLDSLLVFVS